MNGNLTQLEKALRKVAKNSKTIKYTKGFVVRQYICDKRIKK